MGPQPLEVQAGGSVVAAAQCFPPKQNSYTVNEEEARGSQGRLSAQINPCPVLPALPGASTDPV